jgi:hypothetical protein
MVRGRITALDRRAPWTDVLFRLTALPLPVRSGPTMTATQMVLSRATEGGAGCPRVDSRSRHTGAYSRIGPDPCVGTTSIVPLPSEGMPQWRQRVATRGLSLILLPPRPWRPEVGTPGRQPSRACGVLPNRSINGESDSRYVGLSWQPCGLRPVPKRQLACVRHNSTVSVRRRYSSRGGPAEHGPPGSSVAHLRSGLASHELCAETDSAIACDAANMGFGGGFNRTWLT